MIFKKSLLVWSKDLTDFSAQQFCHEEFPFKFFETSVRKETFWKLLTCNIWSNKTFIIHKVSFSNSLLLSFRSRTWDLNSSKQEIKCLPQSKFNSWTRLLKKHWTLRCHIVFSRENKVEEKWRLANLFAVHAHGLKLKTMNWYQLFQYQQGSNPIPPSASEP